MDYVGKDEEVGDEDVEFGWEVHEMWNWFWSCFGGSGCIILLRHFV